MHVCPVAVQSLHELPKLPHVVELGFMHVPPWQQPVRQLSKLQLPPPDEPEELPDELPLEDPLDELLVALPHDPPWQLCIAEVQSLHVAPWTPQAESLVPGLQAPFVSQHPLHDAAQPLAALSVAPLEPDPSSPEDAPLSVPSPPVGVFRPGPVLVGAGAASSTATPASCTVTGVIRIESAPVVPLPPVAHAARAVRTNHPNPLPLGFDEPIATTSGPFPSRVPRPESFLTPGTAHQLRD
jgi:hypothetical protein